MEVFYPLIHIEDSWFPKRLWTGEAFVFWRDWCRSQISIHDWTQISGSVLLQRQINEMDWNLLSQSSKKTIRIRSLWVKAIKRWPWLMGWFKSLIQSLIEPNTPMLQRVSLSFMNFWIRKLSPSTYWTFVLFHSQIHVSLNPTLTPFPPHLSQWWRAARTRRFSGSTHDPSSPCPDMFLI